MSPNRCPGRMPAEPGFVIVAESSPGPRLHRPARGVARSRWRRPPARPGHRGGRLAPGPRPDSARLQARLRAATTPGPGRNGRRSPGNDDADQDRSWNAGGLNVRTLTHVSIGGAPAPPSFRMRVLSTPLILARAPRIGALSPSCPGTRVNQARGEQHAKPSLVLAPGLDSLWPSHGGAFRE